MMRQIFHFISFMLLVLLQGCFWNPAPVNAFQTRPSRCFSHHAPGFTTTISLRRQCSIKTCHDSPGRKIVSRSNLQSNKVVGQSISRLAHSNSFHHDTPPILGLEEDNDEKTTLESLQNTSLDTPPKLQSRRRVMTQFGAALLGGTATSLFFSLSPNGHDTWKAEAAVGNTYPGGNQIKSIKSMGGLPRKIRKVCVVMDELQRDLMQERWDLVEGYPPQLRSYVPIFTQYTDTAFSGDDPAYKGLRVALRYEVGRFFAAVQRLKGAVTRQDLDAAYLAYSDMALHFDRYLNVGNLYTYRDDVIDYAKFYQGIDDSTLVYEDPKKDPALVRDLVVLIKGPDKGKTGIVLGLYQDGSNNCVVKLDAYRSEAGIREIRVVPCSWAAKRLGEQDPDAVFLIPRK